MNSFKKILIPGGAGYVGSRLIPKLLDEGYHVRVLDLFIFDESSLDAVRNHDHLEIMRGDIRNEETVKEALEGCDVVIHLACISNDSSYDFDPVVGKSINYDCFPMMMRLVKETGIKRFIFASSSSVYGLKSEEEVTEDLSLEPLTGYSQCKVLCEELLVKEMDSSCTTFIVRPAAVCGYSPRLKLDITVNILTTTAVVNEKIRLFGGSQKRPSLHIDDMCDIYLNALRWSHEQIHGKIYNVGYKNYTLFEIADLVKSVVGPHVEISAEPTNDLRSYHICSDKIKKELNYEPKRRVQDAVKDLADAFAAGKITDPMNNPRYHNIKTVQQANLK
jgi:nucleoside-diphosphate-sugar epimerase